MCVCLCVYVYIYIYINDTEPTSVALEFAASLGLPIKRLICQVRIHFITVMIKWTGLAPSVRYVKGGICLAL